MKEEINPPFGKVTDHIYVSYCDGDELTSRTYGFDISDGTHTVSIDKLELTFTAGNMAKPFMLHTGNTEHPHRWMLTLKQAQTLLQEIARMLPKYAFEDEVKEKL